MGYSCTVKADNTLQMTLRYANGKNTFDSQLYFSDWTINGQKFFYERGRENNDGSITGCVYLFTDENHARKYGSLKISAEGKVIAWPGMPKKLIIEKAPMFEVIN